MNQTENIVTSILFTVYTSYGKWIVVTARFTLSKCFSATFSFVLILNVSRIYH